MSLARLFEELRPGAFAVAYRMLGSVGEAEDVVQEAFLRLHRTLREGERLQSPRAYLSTVVTRLCIDQLRSARARRERYVGEWLPEPLVASADADPARQAEVADSLSLAFLVLLESLSPEQRAAFLLREVFDYSYEEIARIVGKSEDNARQLVARARRQVEARRPRFEVSRERGNCVADDAVRLVHHRTWDAAGSARRCHAPPKWALGGPAGTRALDAPGSREDSGNRRTSVPRPRPRPRLQAHPRLRRRLRLRRNPDHQDPHPGAERERPCGAVGADGPGGVSGLDADLESTPP
jgi:RNA polymerase sigma factor (sigma-70 family)